MKRPPSPPGYKQTEVGMIPEDWDTSAGPSCLRDLNRRICWSTWPTKLWQPTERDELGQSIRKGPAIRDRKLLWDMALPQS